MQIPSVPFLTGMALAALQGLLIRFGSPPLRSITRSYFAVGYFVCLMFAYVLEPQSGWSLICLVPISAICIRILIFKYFENNQSENTDAIKEKK
jgi:hypothetical protein